MEQVKIGFIGFGEAAYHISKGLIEENRDRVRIIAYDAMLHNETFGPRIQARASELQIGLKDSLSALLHEAELILCATNAKAAREVAEQAAPLVKRHHIYADINSASPMLKREIAERLAQNCLFVDVAVMESVPKKGHRVPLLASGEGAKKFREAGTRLGMDITVLGGEVGASSAVKMVRSIFMKGMTMLLVETTEAARHFGVQPQIMQSLDQTLRSQPLETLADLLIGRTREHARRRVAEMDEVIATLSEVSLDATMSAATKQKLESFL